MIKIAIAEGNGFAPKWIDYCKQNEIPYKIVNPYAFDIIDQLADCGAFMWHHNHGDYRDLLFAKQLLAAVESSGRIVFPNHATGWHFDDKIGEMYLLQSLDLPLVPSYVFYEKNAALAWASKTDYPKVFKLRGGAGAMNVMLVKCEREAINLINKAFSSGFKAFRSKDYFNERFKKWRAGKDSLLGVAKGLVRFVIKPKNSHLIQEQKGYAYFQQFMPGNKFDTRVVVIDGKYALAEKRYVRPNDFRASGSGRFDYDNISHDVIKTAFFAAKKMLVQSVAFDFIIGQDGKPYIIETSYGFGTKGIEKAPGYWDENLEWHEERLDFYGIMVKSVIDKIKA